MCLSTVKLSAAHHIRNRSSLVFSSVCHLNARYRWCLTGTPVHNSLDDYGALLSFVRVYPFRAKSQFMAFIVKPVEDRHELGIQRLQELVRTTCLRRTKQQTLDSGLLSLPHRTQKTCLVHLHPHDQTLYDSVKRVLQKTASGSDRPQRNDVLAKAKEKNVIVLLNVLRLICNHGEELVPQLAGSITGNTSALSIDHIQRQINAAVCSSCGGESNGSGASTESQGSLCVDCARLEKNPSDQQSGVVLEQRDGNSASQAARIGKVVRPSAKVVALVSNLRQEASINNQTHKPRKRYIPVAHRCAKAQHCPDFIQCCIQLLGEDA